MQGWNLGIAKRCFNYKYTKKENEEASKTEEYYRP